MDEETSALILNYLKSSLVIDSTDKYAYLTSSFLEEQFDKKYFKGLSEIFADYVKYSNSSKKGKKDFVKDTFVDIIKCRGFMFDFIRVFSYMSGCLEVDYFDSKKMEIVRGRIDSINVMNLLYVSPAHAYDRGLETLSRRRNTALKDSITLPNGNKTLDYIGIINEVGSSDLIKKIYGVNIDYALHVKIKKEKKSAHSKAFVDAPSKLSSNKGRMFVQF